MNTVSCPECKGTNLQICYPTWFHFKELFGELDATTFVDVDGEADANVFCPDCDGHFEQSDFYTDEVCIAHTIAQKIAAFGSVSVTP